MVLYGYLCIVLEKVNLVLPLLSDEGSRGRGDVILRSYIGESHPHLLSMIE